MKRKISAGENPVESRSESPSMMTSESGVTALEMASNVGRNVGSSCSLYRQGEPAGEMESGKELGETCTKPELVEGSTTL